MDWHVYVRAQLREITGDAARDEEIVEELAQHLAERFEDIRRGGGSDAEALARVTAELQQRDDLARALRQADRPRPVQPIPPAGRSHMLTDLWQDLRYSARLLARNPGFAAAAILTLTLGIGMTTAIFSVVDAVLLRPVPFPEPERLLVVWETDRDTGTTHEPASWPDFVDFEQRSRTVDQFAAFVAAEASLTPERGEPARIATVQTSAEFLPMLGVRPLVGRLFTAEEARRGGPNVVLVSERLWDRLFFRDPSIVGRELRVNDRPQTVIGVVPTTADFGLLQILAAADYGRGFADRDARTRVDLWAPLQADAQSLPRSTHPIVMIGRRAPGASVATAQEEVAAIAADLEKAFPENKARGVFIEPLTEVIFGPTEPALLVLMAAVGLVLLIACVNVANLLLARGTTRLREVAVRSALGAETRRLARQFVVENTLLTLVSAVVGVAVAFVVLRVLVAIAPADIPRLATVSIDARVLAVALGISVIVGFTFGLVPVAQAGRADLRSALNAEDARGATAGRDRGRVRSLLVVAEVALAVVLVIGAGLLIKSFWRIRQVDPGFDVSGVAKAEFQLPSTRYPADFRRYPDFQEMHRFNATLLTRVAGLPGVESAAIAANHPLDAGFTNSFVIVGREAESADFPEISIRRVTPGYFRTLRVPLVSGRLLTDSDAARSAPVVLINEVAAKRFFPDQDALGKQISFWGARRTIVGVLGSERIFGVTEPPPIAVYAPLAQTPGGSEALIVRTAGDPASLAAAMRGAIREIDPGLAVFGVEPLADTLSESVGEQRFMMLLLGLFAMLALLLAAIGIHGVLSYTVAQRTREIGIRMALGAPPQRVTALVFRQGARLSALGLVAGLVLAAIFARTLAGLLFGVSATDVTIFAAVLVVLGAVAMFSTWLPARRAVRVDPLTAIREH
jgi:putative ABC transport system permease protein